MDERTAEMRDTLTSKGTSSSLDFYYMLRSLFRINKECLLILETLLCSTASLSCRKYFLKYKDCTTLHYYLLSIPGAATYQVYFVIPRAMCPDSQMGILC